MSEAVEMRCAVLNEIKAEPKQCEPGDPAHQPKKQPTGYRSIHSVSPAHDDTALGQCRKSFCSLNPPGQVAGSNRGAFSAPNLHQLLGTAEASLRLSSRVPTDCVMPPSP